MFTKYDSRVTQRLAELRDEVDLGQEDVAIFFGLKGETRRNTIGDWENGRGRPAKSRRNKLIKYLWVMLQLRHKPKEFKRIWDEIVVGQWKFTSLTESDLPQDCPKEILGKNALAIPFQMPRALPHFTGRKNELQDLRRKIHMAKEVTLICLHGPPGVGKSAISIQLAHEFKDHFKDGVLWARFGLESTNTMDVLDKFASAYGADLRKYQDYSVRRSMLRSILANKNALIILDNVTNSDEVEAFTPGLGTSFVLVTTRRKDLSAISRNERILIKPFDEKAGEAIKLFGEVLKKRNH